jgi:hypothetical protein
VQGNHLNAVVIFLELSKAYDVLNHQILLDKLEICGVKRVLKSWFKSCLSNPIKFAEIAKIGSNSTLHGYCSLYRGTTYGVPQGSILGPTLFLIYTNNLPSYVQNAKLVLYTDDTNIPVVKDINVLEVKTALVMEQQEAWLFDSELLLNIAKPSAMLFHFS